MEEGILRQANEKKERDKEALIAALSILPSYEDCNNPANIRMLVLAAPGDVDKPLEIIPTLHKAGLLEQYIRELQTEDKLNSLDELQSIIECMLQATPAEPPKLSVRSTSGIASSTASLSVASAGVSHKLGCSGIFSFSPKARENLKTAGMLACPSIGLALFLGTGIAGFVLSAKAAATATAVVACAATAGTAFPPLGIALLAVSAAMILAAVIILAALAISSKKSSPVMNADVSPRIYNGL